MPARLLGFLSTDLAIDLGTANTLVYMKGKGIVAREPSVVATGLTGLGLGRILAVGRDAQRMLGRTPSSVVAVRPVREGVIADFDLCRAMLRHLIRQVRQHRRFLRPRVIVGVPSGITQVEKRAVRESARSAGAREVYLIEELIAAAIGAGLPVTEPSGNMIVDVGGGTTEVAVISLAGVVHSQSVRVAGDKMDEAIAQYVKRKYNLLVGERTAEFVKMSIGRACPDPNGGNAETEVRGRDLVAGLPKTITLRADEVQESLREPVNAMVQAVRAALEKTPPELAADIADRGIVLGGGGALLKGLDALLGQETGLSVVVADDPLSCVAVGAGMALDQPELLREVCC